MNFGDGMHPARAAESGLDTKRKFSGKNGSQNAKTRLLAGFLVTPDDGGYGWTRTTDPSIMSAVL